MEEFKKNFQIRKDIIEKSIFDNTLTEESILETILPELETAKIIETPEINYSYFLQDGLKINGYDRNSTGERLIIFVLNSNSISLNETEEDLLISSKEVYDNVFKMASLFVQRAIRRQIKPPSDKVGVLISMFQNNTFINEIDVIEIIQISLTTTIVKRGNSNSLRLIDFDDDLINVNFTFENKTSNKDILIKRKLIDLNFLKDILVDKSSLTKLVVDFEKYTNGRGLKALEAVKTNDFTSYLAVIPAQIISDLYKNESTKLLENNVRSFLFFKKDANKGMQETIKTEPEKFIAFNNGLTITAKEVEVSNNGGETFIKKLTDFQIVNGGQTTATIYFTNKEHVDISKVFLMAKINVLSDFGESQQDEQNKLLKFVSDISLYSNTQSKVDSVDFTSRSEEVKQIKRLSTSIHPPTRDRWFFELMKGEFNTMIAFEKNEYKKKKIKELYPKNRILEIKSFGKYWGAWGDIPYLVKLGGVKFNGVFLNDLKRIGVKNIDRTFYEDAIAKCILWESFFNIYGAGKNSLGQLRASVVPYSIAAIYINTDGAKGQFNFTKIWIEQKINLNFEIWSRELMVLMNELIKKYAISENIEDGSKRKELWDSIKASNELMTFFKLPNAALVLNEYKKNEKNKTTIKSVDFSELFVKVEVLNRGYEFYKYIKNEAIKYEPNIGGKVSRIIDRSYIMKGGVYIPQEISYDDAIILKELLINLSNNYNIDENKLEDSDDLLFCLDKIIEIYNECISANLDIESEFLKYSTLSEIKAIQYAPSAIRKVGLTLKKGELPSVNDVFYSSNYFNEKNKKYSLKTDTSIETIRLEDNPNVDLIYLKKIVNQDLERTPTFSVDAIHGFFKIKLKNGASKVIRIENLTSNNNFEIKFKLRGTRNEYRVFLNKLFEEIAPNEKDILIFRKKFDNEYTCEHISFKNKEYKKWESLFDKNKNHKVCFT